MTDAERRDGYEPWVWGAFGLVASLVAGLVVLGSRPGGALAVWIHGPGMATIGLVAALSMAGALAWSAWRRPMLQRRRLHGLLALAAVVWVSSFPLAFPSSHEGHPCEVVFSPPFRGVRTVAMAGDERATNPLVLGAATRFGVAFRGAEPGAEVLAPAEATVERVEAGEVVLRPAGAPELLLVLRGVRALDALTAGKPVVAGEAVGHDAGELLVVYLHDGPGEGVPMRFAGFDAGPAGGRAGGFVPGAEARTSSGFDEAPR